jgi:general secretion pathway protein B
VSLILDALNRSRHDADPVPGLDTPHQIEPVSAQSRPYLVWAALAAALVVIAWLVLDRFVTAPTPAADIGAPVAELSGNIGSAVTSVTAELKSRAAAAAPVAQAVVAEPAPAAEPPVAPVNPAPPGSAVTNASLATAQTESANLPAPTPVPNSASVAGEPVETPPVSTAEDAAVAQLYKNRDMAEESVTPAPASRAQVRASQRELDTAVEYDSAVARSEESVEIDKILEQARQEIENSSLDDHPVPFLSDLSQQTKDDIPTLYYHRHDYSSDRNQSSVVLNGATFKAGESPLPGMQLEEILPDSVVLNYRGMQFRLRALNSWVNM